MDPFDLVVLGAGPGGSTAALRAAELGMKVACIDRRAAPGGTCLHIGCIPSKALLESSRIFALARDDMARHGVVTDAVRLDLATMMKRKDRAVRQLARGLGSRFAQSTITILSGTARVESPTSVRVDGTDGFSRLLHARHILVATGSRPAPLPFAPFDGERILSSEEALALDRVPESLLVVGAGAIGLELGSVWNRLGTRVTLVEAQERILPSMDAAITGEAADLFTRQGLTIRTNTTVRSLLPAPSGVSITLDPEEVLDASLALVAIGRTPGTRGLGLEEAGVILRPDGTVEVDETLTTNVPTIHALGDVTPGPMVAHRAEEEGMALAEALSGRPARKRPAAIPEVVYTHPEVASIGRTGQDLQEADESFSVGTFSYRANGRARTAGETHGTVRMLCLRESGALLGVHILGAGAGDLANEASLAIHQGCTADDLAASSHAHPTFGEALRGAALAALSA